MEEWKQQVETLLVRDTVHHLNNKDKLKNAINEARVLKLPESMTKELVHVFD